MAGDHLVAVGPQAQVALELSGGARDGARLPAGLVPEIRGRYIGSEMHALSTYLRVTGKPRTLEVRCTGDT